MSDEYLWDGSGHPDHEVEHLEQLLGNLRYEPRVFEMPEPLSLAMPPRRRHRLKLAVAAAFLLTFLAAGIWLRWQRDGDHGGNYPAIAAVENGSAEHRRKSAPEELPIVKHVEPKNVIEGELANGLSAGSWQDQTIRHALQDGRPKKLETHRHVARAASLYQVATVERRSLLDQRTRDEGERVKAQLMLALYISSNKLNGAQRKVQENSHHEPHT